MENLKDMVKSILEKGFLLSLATVDKNGVWVADVAYVNDDKLNIYWLSPENVRHSQAIEKNPKVAGTITITSKASEPDEGLQIEGMAEKINGDILDMAIKFSLKKGRAPPKKKGEFLDYYERKYGDKRYWYRLKPTKIVVIYQPLFWFNKKILELK